MPNNKWKTIKRCMLQLQLPVANPVGGSIVQWQCVRSSAIDNDPKNGSWTNE